MRFAHFADVHIGSWRDPRMNDITIRAFSKAIDICLEKNVDFILISGDFFNTSFPSIERLKETVTKLKQIKDNNIPMYVIAGSHDYSPTGKTMLDVLENAGLFQNVMRGSVVDNKLRLNFTVDPKTGAKITGIVGKKGMLDRVFYENLDKSNLEAEDGFKIFMFHTALTEFKPKELEKMDSSPISLLPKGFKYYAGGHVHSYLEKNVPDYGLITMPGPMFPNNFREIEKLGKGGFFIVDTEPDLNANWIGIEIYKTKCYRFDCNLKSTEKINEEVLRELNDQSYKDTIVLLRFDGKLSSGRISDINFKDIFDHLYSKGAHFVMKNTASLSNVEFEEIKMDSSIENIESTVIKEHLGQIKSQFSLEQEESISKDLISSLAQEKEEGERLVDFESRVLDDVKKVLKLEF